MTPESTAKPQQQQTREPVTTASGTGTATEPDKSAGNTRELWISAREEYHRGNIEASIRNYQQVIASSSDNYDAYGEMGNVYLRMGNTKEAANAYFQAAAILVRKGEMRRASSLMPVLQRLDRGKAQELNQLLNKSTS